MYIYIQGGPKIGKQYIVYSIVLIHYTYFGPPCIYIYIYIYIYICIYTYIHNRL